MLGEPVAVLMSYKLPVLITRFVANSPDHQEMDLRPSKILGIGVNYHAHATEMGKQPPEEPLVFLKPPSALVGDGDAIVRPRGYQRVDFEGELAVVIGRRGRRIQIEEALDYVLGYSCLIDVTVRDLQKKDGQWARAKGFDTFCPMGPCVVGGLDPRDLHLTTRVNGVVRQDSSTADLIFSVPTVISFISQAMTLEPGDVITTGTPSGVGNLEVGDQVEVEIQGIGILHSHVVDDRAG